MTEKYLQYILSRSGLSPVWVWQQFMLIPNCNPPGEGWIADLLAVSRARYCTEVEIKVSFSDWKRDRDKEKYQPPGPLFRERKDPRPVIKKFYYAGPLELMLRHEEVWTAPGSGIIGVDNKEDGDLRIQILREPTPDKTARPLEAHELLSLGRTCMVRYWTWAAEKHGDILEPETLVDLAPEPTPATT